MKRVCSGCRAYGMVGEHSCGLGYETETTYFGVYHIAKTKPLEECPKPLTNDKLIELMKKERR